METENKIILFWLVTRANLARLSNGDLLCRSSQSPKRHGSEASPVIDRVVGEREKREGRISKPGNRDKNVFPFSALFSPPLSHSIARAQSLLFSFVFFSLSFLLGHPPPSPTDGPLKLSAPSRPSFHLSRPRRDTHATRFFELH